jgi:hypothetical protein
MACVPSVVHLLEFGTNTVLKSHCRQLILPRYIGTLARFGNSVSSKSWFISCCHGEPYGEES